MPPSAARRETASHHRRHLLWRGHSSVDLRGRKSSPFHGSGIVGQDRWRFVARRLSMKSVRPAPLYRGLFGLVLAGSLGGTAPVAAAQAIESRTAEADGVKL